ASTLFAQFLLALDYWHQTHDEASSFCFDFAGTCFFATTCARKSSRRAARPCRRSDPSRRETAHPGNSQRRKNQRRSFSRRAARRNRANGAEKAGNHDYWGFAGKRSREIQMGTRGI